jgi:hypothetical protein
MLFVASIEALFTPWQEWRKNQSVKRFIKGILDLCPDAVDEMLAQPNLEMALGFRKRGRQARQRKDVLNHIYDLRSQPAHAGLGLSGDAMASLAEPSRLRLVLLSDLARSAILAFLQAPRSSLVGHPGFRSADPA